MKQFRKHRTKIHHPEETIVRLEKPLAIFFFTLWLCVCVSILSLSFSFVVAFSKSYFIPCARLPISISMMYERFVCRFRLLFGLHGFYSAFFPSRFVLCLPLALTAIVPFVHNGVVELWSALFVSKARAKAKIKIKINTIVKQHNTNHITHRTGAKRTNC